MLAIKLKRIGKKHQAAYRFIVAEKRSKLGGRFVEDLGWWNPKSEQFKINKDRANYWLKSGAKPTATVHNLFINADVIQGKKIAVHKKPKKIKAGEETLIKEESKV